MGNYICKKNFQQNKSMVSTANRLFDGKNPNEVVFG